MISLSDINNILGETSYCLRDICQSSNINKWSLYKPVLNDKRTTLTQEDFEDTNFGFNNYNYTIVFDKDSRNTLWTYSPRTSPFRLSDFKNYNHYTKFIDISNDGDSIINLGGQIRCSFIGDINYIVNHFNALKTFSDPLYLCILLITGNYNQGYVYRVCDIDDYDNDDIRFYAANIPVGTYTVIPILTNNSQVNNMQDKTIRGFQNSQGKYFVLPAYCEYTVEIQNQTIDFFDVIDFNLSNVDFEYDNYWLYNFAVTSEIINHDSREYHISMSIEYSNTLQGNITLGTHSCTLDGSINNDTKYIFNSTQYETVTDAQLYDGIISVSLSASITYGNTTQTKQWTTILEKD